MKVYLDENDYVITYCAMTGRESLETSKSPIIVESLSDYTKQVRNEVVQKIREKLKPKEIFHPEDEFEIDYDFYYKEDVEEILDQLEEDKEKL